MGKGLFIAAGMTVIMGFCPRVMAQTMPSANPALPIQDLPPEQRADLEINKLDARLNLTEEQKLQLRQVFSTIDNEQELTKTYNETDPLKTAATNRGLNLQKQNAINQVLTPDQQARLNSNWGTGLP